MIESRAVVIFWLIIAFMLKGMAFYNLTCFWIGDRIDKKELKKIVMFTIIATIGIFPAFNISVIIIADVICIVISSFFMCTDFAVKMYSIINMIIIFATVDIIVDLFRYKSMSIPFLVCCVVLYIVSVILREKSAVNIMFGDIKSSIFILFVEILLILSYIVILKNIINNNGDVYLWNAILLISQLSLLALYNLVLFYYEKSKSEEIIHNQNYMYKNQINLLNEYYDEIRAIKHDMNNEMIAIYNLVKDCDANKIEQAVARINKYIESDYLKRKIINTGNTEIDGIINYKCAQAEKKNINCNLNIEIPSDMAISMFNISIVLGNLFDNAIEALDGMDDKWIKVIMSYKKENLIIAMSNPYRGEITRYKDGYKTKKENKTEHGYGLRNIKTIVNKCDGTIIIDSSNNVFDVNIALPIRL